MAKEKDFQIRFGKWASRFCFESAAYELKEARGKSLPVSAVKEHQVRALKQSANGTFFFKIPDAGFQNPYDCYSLYKVPAYVVIHYQGNEAVMIPVEMFERIVKTGVKSISEELAKQFGKTITLI